MKKEFYVPGILVAGSDLSRMYPSDIFLQNISVTYRQSETTTTEIPTTETPEQFHCSGSKFIECSGCNTFAVKKSIY